MRRLTGSRYCYVTYIDPENGDSVAIKFSQVTSQCAYYNSMGEARFKVQKNGKYGGLLGYSMDTGKSFFTNDPTNHPIAHGIPKDHKIIRRFLSVAVKYDNKVLGQIVLADPPRDYNVNDLKISIEIGQPYARILQGFYDGRIPLK
ncbi:histidine kinase [Methanothermobacter tenebrarum]|uniref:Histidine kinase n=1 Tax=Methanothermobacter tenebrarum TaxID=680118 RepID=A0ABM7YDA4_9EURY|nr:histidine kinase [Methanothermobacter tenebrarum]